MPKRKRELLRKSAASGVKGEDSGLKEKSWGSKYGEEIIWKKRGSQENEQKREQK